MKSLTDTFQLRNKVEIPCIGYGTWKTPDGETASVSVKTAIELGYRHIDTAAAYGNETSVGEGIRESGISREQLFVTSKVWNTERGYEKTLHAFDRYSEFIFAGKCWRVEAPDSISMKNIIEINAEENYWNDTTDDLEKEMKDGLVFEPINPTPDTTIIGETFIKPKIAATYSVDVADGEWKILEDVPACVKATGNQTATVTWNKTTSGQFTLQWVKGNDVREKVIVVESLY